MYCNHVICLFAFFLLLFIPSITYLSKNLSMICYSAFLLTPTSIFIFCHLVIVSILFPFLINENKSQTILTGKKN